MKIQRDLTIAGFAKYYLGKLEKDVQKLSREVEQLKQDRLRYSRHNKIRRK